MLWLLREDVAQHLRDLRTNVRPTADRMLEHEQRHARRSDGPSSLIMGGDVAEIRVAGVLTKRPDFWAWFAGYDNTTYEDLHQAIQAVRNDATVKSVRVHVDSVGGAADGLFDLIGALEQLRAEKSVTVRAENAFSAAYGIAAAAGPIEAQGPGSMFGSVGVAVRYAQWADVAVYDITNTDSPDKRPDPSTAEGQAVIRRELDAIYELFAGAIARGRSTSVEDVRENFGRGASFVAAEAKRRGMIDTIAGPELRVVSKSASAKTGGGGRTNNMDLEELRSQHPALYAEAVQVGVTQERDRVCAHLTMGEQSGDMATAMGAIRSGDGMTLTITAQYMAAGMNRASRATRQAETDAAGAALDGAQPATETPETDLAAQVVKKLEERRGERA